mgnify:CR=1 FL=1
MAIVFISPKERQKVFFLGITAVFVLILLVIALSVFFSKPRAEITGQAALINPKININFKALESDQATYITPMGTIDKIFAYVAADAKGVVKTGVIAFPTEDEARKFLLDKGWNINKLEELEVGRENPFTPYYSL